MVEVTNNIFLTTENLAFSMPLLLVCFVYVYFKYIPLQYGALGIAAAFVLYQIRSQMVAQHEKKLTNLDENAIRDLIGEEDEEETKAAKDAKNKKAVAKVQARLAQERKQAEKNKKKKPKAKDDEANDDDFLRFAKGSRPVKAKKN